MYHLLFINLLEMIPYYLDFSMQITTIFYLGCPNFDPHCTSMTG